MLPPNPADLVKMCEAAYVDDPELGEVFKQMKEMIDSRKQGQPTNTLSPYQILRNAEVVMNKARKQMQQKAAEVSARHIKDAADIQELQEIQQAAIELFETSRIEYEASIDSNPHKVTDIPLTVSEAIGFCNPADGWEACIDYLRQQKQIADIAEDEAKEMALLAMDEDGQEKGITTEQIHEHEEAQAQAQEDSASHISGQKREQPDDEQTIQDDISHKDNKHLGSAEAQKIVESRNSDWHSAAENNL